MQARIEACVYRCIDNFMAAVINNNGASVVHLLALYLAESGITLTADAAMLNQDFLQWAAKKLGIYKKRLASRTSVFNLGGKRRFTPANLLHCVILSDFAESVKNKSYGNTYHDEFVTLPLYEEVPYWQAPGTGFAWADISKIDVVANVDSDGTTASVSKANIVAVMFDDDALGILQPRKRVTTQYNPKNETYNDFHKWDSRYFNDFNEQMIVFILD